MIERRTSSTAVDDGVAASVESRSVERNDPVDVDVGVDEARIDPERVSRADEGREITDGEGAPAVVMAWAASAASTDARGTASLSDGEETRGVVAGRAPSSAEPVVRASSRRRKDSAAAAPAPVSTVDCDGAGFVARDRDVDRVPVADVEADAERNVVPGALEARRWIVPTRSDDEDESIPIWRSATVRATNPTNGDRAEPPGKVVTRSTVAVGCRRGPVWADTARRTLCRRRTGDVSGCDAVEGGDARRAVNVVALGWLIAPDAFAAGDEVVDTERRGADRVVVDARRTEESDERLLRGDVTARRAVLDVVIDADVDAADRRLGADSDAWVAT